MAEFPRIIGRPVVPVLDEAEHFIVCADCGQAIDCRDLGDVFYHEHPGHTPKAIDG